MHLRHIASFVIPLATVVVAALPGAQEQVESLTDPDAYAVYGAVLTNFWNRVSKDTLVLQQETEGLGDPLATQCSLHIASDSEWSLVETNFKLANARTYVLGWTLPLDIPYRLISRAAIRADDARLAVKDPGLWQTRPESMNYAAVSAVGFNAAKDKAIIYVRARGQGEIGAWERREGKWVPAKGGESCLWIARERGGTGVPLTLASREDIEHVP